MTTTALTVPDPRHDPVPAGWWESAVLPVIQACDSWAGLDEYEAQLGAMATLIEGMGGDRLEFEKALRVVDCRRGELAGVDAVSGKHRVLNTHVKDVPPDVSAMSLSRYRQLARHWKRQLYPYLLQQTEAAKVTQAKLLQLIQKGINKQKLDAIQSRAVVTVFDQLYDVIVIDPPWPMEKIERDVAPNQSHFDYPTMTEEELTEFVLPTRADCHVWTWTTHRFLPMAFRLLDAWGLTYVCTFVWHKPGGFQPFGLPQYNCEFALYARRGSPSFVSTKDFNVCFSAPRGKHSEKPVAFYDLVSRVTAGDRIDIFSRRTIAGFTGWGNEAS